ncbi:MAG: peptidylprolyl isomerase [Verrucomicrobia bacterium]|nr:peptidylprolyl isomerase [Verrucomicrobiota bacterium]MDA1088599.1 peptidylprolyl isomerase [Verrucomicrobiota bacterium]
MTISDKHVVSIHYKLTDSAGEVIDSSDGGEPMNYLHGSGSIVPGLEQELTGKSAGDQLQVTVPPGLGYGERNEELVQVVPREAFGEVKDIEPGMRFQASAENGDAQVITVSAVSDTDVTVDGNHPLAGQVLHFDVTVDSVREASQSELDHGHVH